jgi:hypothetical protein
MELVIILKIVQVVQVIVAHVLQPNIVEIMFVIMVKPVIHVVQIVLRALMYVGMGNVQAQRIVCHVLGIVDHAHLLRSVGMDFVIVCMNHARLVSKIAGHVIILVVMDTVIV